MVSNFAFINIIAFSPVRVVDRFETSFAGTVVVTRNVGAVAVITTVIKVTCTLIDVLTAKLGFMFFITRPAKTCKSTRIVMTSGMVTANSDWVWFALVDIITVRSAESFVADTLTVLAVRVVRTLEGHAWIIL